MSNASPIRTRREFLAQNALGMGSVALATLLHQDKLLGTPANVPRGPQNYNLDLKKPHFKSFLAKNSTIGW